MLFYYVKMQVLMQLLRNVLSFECFGSILRFFFIADFLPLNIPSPSEELSSEGTVYTVLSELSSVKTV